MTTTTRPATAGEHAAESRRLLSLVRATGLTDTEREETYAYENAAGILAAAQAHATLALVEEQRTANLIAAFERDAITSPHTAPDLSHERRTYWDSVARGITRRVGLDTTEVSA